ncbi:heme biosynthesis HemY N-terminal domain-containing protein [Caldimonas tepidiphila]|uniref:heme biosynthesis HemY N-terminal domain-containing protein n=1 Tax=Caldimonas tepidiphila TaxID=2315841 RepID=UPI000E5A97A3|nr:heme biosynthesis HemY N-terminal domain-containing protein [Caldimonas tepidiphila]
MRAIIWLVLLFAVAVVSATAFGRNDALVTFYWAPWRLDLSLNLFLIALVLGFLTIYAFVNGVGALVRLPARAREWRNAKRERLAQQALREALSLYFGGRYSRAHKAAQRALAIQAETRGIDDDREFTMLGELLAAGSMHRLQDRARRDDHLARALGAGGSPATRAAEEGARLLAAEWALDDRDAERALQLIGELAPGVARRTQALRLKLQASQLALQPLDALKTARLLAKHQAFSPGAAKGLLRSLACDALDSAYDADQLRRVWQQLEVADRRDPFVAAHAAQRMGVLGGRAEARAWLRPFWDHIAERSEDERAVLADALVSCIEGIEPEWLPRLEAAGRLQPRDAALSHAIGRALAAVQLWGKARQQLEVSAIDATLPAVQRRDAWLRLAEIAEREADLERATECYRQAALVA